jgi:hypothetical protein
MALSAYRGKPKEIPCAKGLENGHLQRLKTTAKLYKNILKNPLLLLLIVVY